MPNILIILLSIIALPFSGQRFQSEPKIVSDPKLASELKSTPEKYMVGDKCIVLTSYLWRDFQPICEINGNKMIGVCKLKVEDKAPILSNSTLKKMFVIKGDEIWIAEISEIKRYTEFLLEGTGRNGPKWGPEIEVDVVCEFEINGVNARVQSKSIMIGRAE